MLFLPELCLEVCIFVWTSPDTFIRFPDLHADLIPGSGVLSGCQSLMSVRLCGTGDGMLLFEYPEISASSGVQSSLHFMH